MATNAPTLSRSSTAAMATGKKRMPPGYEARGGVATGWREAFPTGVPGEGDGTLARAAAPTGPAPTCLSAPARPR
ncbi:hypothetical protein GCM10009605_61980 [Nocardiopsis composta]